MKLAIIFAMASLAFASAALADTTSPCPQLQGKYFRLYDPSQPSKGGDTILVAERARNGVAEYWIRYFWSSSPDSPVSDNVYTADNVPVTRQGSGDFGGVVMTRDVDCRSGALLVVTTAHIGRAVTSVSRYSLDSSGGLVYQEGYFEPAQGPDFPFKPEQTRVFTRQ